MSHRDISASLLQNILQTGHLNYDTTMKGLMDLTDSKIGQFFEKSQTGSLFICKFTSNERYIVDEKYAIDNLPVNQYAIYYRNQIIAIVSLDNQDFLDDLPDDYQRRIHHSICIGLVLNNLRDSKYSFTISVCNALASIVSHVIEMFDNLAPTLRTEQKYVDQINSALNDIIAIIYDVTDYLEIDAEKVSLQKNVVDIPLFISNIVTQFESIFNYKVYYDIHDNARRSFMFDKRWVHTMLMSILKKTVSVPNLQLYISVASRNVLVITVFSPTSRGEIMKKVQAEKISVNNLDIFIVKRLCDIMKGKLEVDQSGVSISITVDNV